MSGEESGKDKLILCYPAIRGTIQPVRNLLLYLQADWQEVSSRIHEGEAEFNSGFPRLIHGDLELTEIIAIFRHIARISGRLDLLGLTPQSRAIINEFLFKFAEIKKRMMKILSDAAVNIWTGKGDSEETKLAALKQFLEVDCRVVKNLLHLHMKNRSWVMGYLTIADFFFYEICFYLCNFLGSVLRNHAIYRNILGFKNMFEAQEFFALHRQQICKMKIFPPFKNKTTLQVMQNMWEGEKEIIT